MMKRYKVVQVSSAESLEMSLNELSQAGWRVVSANIAYQTEGKHTPTYFALLENAPIEIELKHMLEHEPDEIENIEIKPSAN